MAKKTAKEPIIMLMAKDMLEDLKMTINTAKEPYTSLMEANMKGNLKMT